MRRRALSLLYSVVKPLETAEAAVDRIEASYLMMTDT